MTFSIHTIALARTPYTEKFGIPRQPGLVPSAKARIEFIEPFNRQEAIEGIELSSHLWLSFMFHENYRPPENGNNEIQWNPSVRPPRLGGNKKMGVFATRAPVRPNPIGLSVVTLEGIEQSKNTLSLIVSGIDLLDGTPIIDIKPYVPYCDSLPGAYNHFAHSEPKSLDVSFARECLNDLKSHSTRLKQPLESLLTQILSQDPRPQFHKFDAQRVYAMKLFDLDIQWRCSTSDQNNQASAIEVMALQAL